MTLKSIKERLNKNAVAIQLPIGQDSAFEGIIDLIQQKAYKFEGTNGENVVEIELPQDMLESVKKYREEMIEKISETDEKLTEKYLNGEELSTEEIKTALRQAVLKLEIFPVLCGDALSNKGVQLMLDAVVDYLPSPLDVPAIEAHDVDDETKMILKHASDEEPFAALAFKIATDPFVGSLAFFRVYSGIVKAGSYVYNSTTGEKERLGRILRMHANTREDVTEVYAGDIAAAVGLKGTTTGDTLCDEKNPVILEKITFPEPVISVVVEPKTKTDQEKMGMALAKLQQEDPTFKVKTDEETLETVISGMGELHLDVLVDRMKREFKVECNVGQPQVAYKETIKKIAEAEGKYIKQSGGRGQYGHCWLRVEPKAKEEGADIKAENFEFVDEIKGGIIPREYIPAIQKGVREAMDKGVLAGYPMVDVCVAVYDGSYHDVDSSEVAFKMAGSMAFQAACKQAGAVILEPIMKIEVSVPEEYMGDVIGDLNSRRAKINEMKDRNNLKIIDGEVPLSEMFGYVTTLRSMTQGRGTSTMEFDHYAEVPNNVAAKIIEKRGVKKGE